MAKKAKFERQISITVQPSVFEKVKAITDRKEVSISEFMRSLIDDNLDNIFKGQQQEKEQENSIHADNIESNAFIMNGKLEDLLK